MEPDREDRSAGPACLRDAQLWETQIWEAQLWETQLWAARIRDEWRRRSLATGWRMPGDWDSEAVEEVLGACQNRALARGEAGLAAAGAPALAAASAALAAACAGLGRSRARAGVGIAETIDDLAALFAVLSEGEGRQWNSPLQLVGAIAEGWAEESVSQFAHVGCEDPLSGLATLSYLRTRLAEVYREAEQGGPSPAETHRLLVVGLPRRPDPWRRLALPILVGRDLRAAFPGGETLSLAKPGPAIALVPARSDLPLRYARLRRNIQAAFGTQIRMTPLPGRLTEALRLVDELAR